MQVNKGKKPLFTAMCNEKDINELKSIFAVFNNNLKNKRKDDYKRVKPSAFW